MMRRAIKSAQCRASVPVIFSLFSDEYITIFDADCQIKTHSGDTLSLHCGIFFFIIRNESTGMWFGAVRKPIKKRCDLFVLYPPDEKYGRGASIIFCRVPRLGRGAVGHISKADGVILFDDFLNSPTAILGGF